MKLPFFRALVPAFLFVSSPLSAVDQIVTSTADSGAGSLRQAIVDAVSGDTITFDSSLDGATITLSSGQLFIDKNLTIDASSLPDGIVIDANQSSRCFTIDTLTDVTLRALTITGGLTGTNGLGGGIRNDGALTLEACTIHDCKTGDHGGGIYNNNAGFLFLTNCTLANNVASNTGSDGNGGALWSSGTATLVSCTLTGNSGYNGGGIHIASASSLSLTNTIVSGNTVFNLGPDIRNTVTSTAGVNFIGDDSDALGLGTINIDYLTGDAQLAPFGNYGGPTPTFPPFIGSPVLDAGLAIPAPPTDQRGIARPVGSAPDIGAIEANFTSGNLSPANGATEGARFPAFQWSRPLEIAGFERYEIHLDTGAGFSVLNDNLTNIADTGFTITSPLPASTQITWRLDVIFTDANGSEVTSSSTTSSFTTRTNSPEVTAISDQVDGYQTNGTSLREAIADAADGETITFNESLDGATLFLDGSGLLLERSITIDASSLNEGIVIDANGSSHCFQIDAAATNVTFKSLTITGGLTGSNGLGGGIRNDGTLALEACTIHDCKAGDHGGGIYNTGTLTLTNCTLANNKARNNGSDGNGGALWSDNTISLISCTLTGNSGQNGGGMHIASSSSVSLENTIISGNTANNQGPDIRNAVTSTGGVNFIGDDSDASGLGTLNTDYLTGDAMLASLGDYGGPTPTAPPLPGSPVLDAGLTATALSTDQRGSSRVIDSNFPKDGSATLDIGAVEIASIQVNSLTDEDDTDFTGGDLSLREALKPANSPESIFVTFAPTLSGGILTLGSQLEITQEVIIDASTLTSPLILSGNSSSRILNINPSSGPTRVTLRGLHFTGGNAASAGAIYNRADGITSISDCAFEGNTAELGGAIRNAGTLDLVGVTFSNNTASGAAGTTTQGGALNNNASATATLTNCTLTGNSTTNNSGGALINRGTLLIESSTIFGNTAPFGGGVRQVDGDLTISNSIIAGNNPAADVYSSGGTVTLVGANLIGDNDTIATEAPADGILIGTSAAPIDPLLGVLADNGGSTPTNLPAPGSPAIDAALFSSLTTDQRGVARPLGSAPDLGAVEADYAFANLAPADSSTGIARFPVFRWSQPAETDQFQRYEIYLDSGAGFQLLDDNITDIATTTFKASFPVSASTSVTWRVDAIYSGGTSSTTATSFTTRNRNPTVTTIDDQDNGIKNGGTSLREAISDAADGETITFAPDINDGIIGNTMSLYPRGHLVISRNITIDASSLSKQLAIEGASSRCFLIEAAASNVILRSLSMSSVASLNENGGAILNEGTLTLESCNIHSCRIMAFGGGIANTGTLTMINSSVYSCHGIDHGGGIYNTGTLYLTNCSLANNVASSDIFVFASGGGIWNNGAATLTSCTLTGNLSGSGGGFFNDSGFLSLENTIIAENNATEDGPDIFNHVSSVSGVNFIGNPSGATGLGTLNNDYLTGDALLAPLGSYGGPTQTIALLPGSPAIDTGGTVLETTDQRGFARVIGSSADIGAYEFGNPGAAGFANYARETIPSGGDDSYSGDPDFDQLPSGLEYAIGTIAGLSDPESSRVPTIAAAPGEGLAFTFGFNPAATVDTTWVVMRTTDLDHSQATEIYRYDGPTLMETTATGVSAVISADQIIVTDATPPPSNNVFYYLGAIQQ